MTLACEATVSGTIYVSSNVLNYREVLTTRSHWGQEVPSISLTELAKDDNLQNELDTHISQYKGENRRIVKQWVNSYLKSNHITFIGRAIRKIRWIMSGRKSWLEQTELIEMNIKIDKLLREKIIE